MSGPARPVRVLHVTTSLGLGGAQTALTRLIEATDFERVEPAVLSLVEGGVFAGRLRAAGANVRDLGLRQGSWNPLALARAGRVAKAGGFDLVQGWMYHGNLAASLIAARSPGRVPVAWNVRHSLDALGEEKPVRRALIRLGAKLSGGTAAVIYNSLEAARQHEALGYDPVKRVFLPNGFDTGLFRPREGAGERLRAELNLSAGAFVVAQVARGHPMKDSEGLARACRLAVDAGVDLRLLYVGRKLDPANGSLARAVAEAGLGGRALLLGQRDGVHELMAGLDLFASPSAWGEGFPNALAEAMACGLPCVATDVGDSARILGDAGWAVPPRDAAALAAAIVEAARMPPDGRRALGERARARVVANYALPAVAERYAELYERLVGRPALSAAEAA